LNTPEGTHRVLAEHFFEFLVGQAIGDGRKFTPKTTYVVGFFRSAMV
jgi:hypothetical protein